MAYVTINVAEIDVGDALKKELFDKIKDNLDDHETRINTIEGAQGTYEAMNLTVRNVNQGGTLTGLHYLEAPFAFTLISAEIRIFEKGTLTGAIEIDVKKSTSGLNSGDFTSVFTTRPKITFASASNYDRSTNQVFDVTQISVAFKDTLRVDVTQLPASGIIGKFRIVLLGEI